MNIEKLARQIAMKYVYGDHNALTDEQEIQDITKDITDLVIENEAKSHGVLDSVSKRLSIKLEDWHHQCGDGCCDMYGTEIALNGKKCDNQCAGDDVRTALEFVLTDLGYEVDVDVC